MHDAELCPQEHKRRVGHFVTSYTVTAATPEGERVFLDVAPNGWLVMLRQPTFHHHGPKLRDVVFAAVMDPHLTDVQVTEQENNE